TEKASVPAGEFENCVKIKETTPLEADTVEHKVYAPKVGQVIDGGLKLVKYGMNVEPMPARPAGGQQQGNARPPLAAPWARVALIEDMAADAMDDTNAAAFAEAYKDLANIAGRLTGAGQ